MVIRSLFLLALCLTFAIAYCFFLQLADRQFILHQKEFFQYRLKR